MALSIPEALSKIGKPWSPHLVARVDDAYDVKIAKIEGEFIFHSHPENDELFYILSGALDMHIEDSEGPLNRVVHMQKGDVFVVPKGVRHKPVGVGEGGKAEILLLEKVGTVNTGDAGDTGGRKAELKDARDIE